MSGVLQGVAKIFMEVNHFLFLSWSLKNNFW